MTPAQIAASLTPAQVRALKAPKECSRADLMALATFLFSLGGLRLWGVGGYTDLGRAVLAEMENRHD